MKIGETSGCLEVTGLYSDIEEEIHKIEHDLANKEWEKYDNWRSWGDKTFSQHYKLSKEEKALFESKKEMPDSFVPKYLDNCWGLDSPKMLYHRMHPKTSYELDEAYKNKALFGVRCNKCGRQLITDETSFRCVKWQTCVGAECSKSSISHIDTDYSKSLYEWNEKTAIVANLNTQLEKADKLSTPLSYYSSPTFKEPSLHIAYISDIHLLHHLDFYDSIENTIKDIARQLHHSLSGEKIILFAGDTSSVKEVTIEFYRQFLLRIKYKKLLSVKEDIEDIRIYTSGELSRRKDYYEKKADSLEKYIEHLKKKLLKEYGLKYKSFTTYYDTYSRGYGKETVYLDYKKTKGFKSLKIGSDKEIELDGYMREIFGHEDRVSRYRHRVEDIGFEIENFEDLTEKIKKPIDEIDLTYLNMKSLAPSEKIFVILGNHEYMDFCDTKSAVEYYQEHLSQMGITLLHNSSYEGETKEGKKYMIYGGTGFAKYNLSYNATNTISSKGFTREDEIKETDLFEEGYRSAYRYSLDNQTCFICASHYPTSSCLSEYNKETIYFSGHDHNNTYCKNQNRVVYADNQTGYHRTDIEFKCASTGFEVNPYASLNDGLFVTTIEDYLKFYRYIGESVGEGALLYKRCENNKANLYVIKRKGYYGFFIMCPHKGKSKGISIVNGGITKKITTDTDMNWICDNFDKVLNKYLSVLVPLRQVQEKLSEELMQMGLYGTIHGTIVDIDFYHHIMVDPTLGKVVLYYSPSFGLIQEIPDFDSAIDSMEIYGLRDGRYYDNLRLMHKAQSKKKTYLLSKIKDSCLIETKGMDKTARNEIRQVETKMGSYGVSRRVNPLQRLFTGHVLREFDANLI